MVNLLEALTRECAPFQCFAPEGQNRITRTDIAPETWHPWSDFTYANITAIFREQLATEYYGEGEPRPLEKDTSIHNEDAGREPLQAYWSCVSDVILDGGTYLNLVPGDTRISSKWCPELHDDPERFYEWQNAVAQTVSYSAEHRVR
ncbi:hypothetical protein B0T16DRAFT_460982 [Cercophora newfieldiana]|uniref:Uncharacterized protein n=1 Tax=Cercophora newfieldiana TaxID=92897 RepID=A0AA39XW06_9PEZI|nr:hypothetical protein B0T16DRAFT_460982 [Cercophora newfieldiana]